MQKMVDCDRVKFTSRAGRSGAAAHRGVSVSCFLRWGRRAGFARFALPIALTAPSHPLTRKAMTSNVPDSLIPYDEIVQEALRAVVGRVLGSVAATQSLPGGHHFYITFKTHAPGVDIPQRLIERFPDEMTIVMQHRFWDLTVDDTKFSVGLSFNQIASTLVIPFSAITGFHDPAVNFELRFQASELDLPDEEHEIAENDGPTITPAGDGSNVVSVDFSRKK